MRIGGRLDLTAARVRADVRLIGVAIDDELGLQAAEVGGNLLCRAGGRTRSRLSDGAWLRGVHVQGTADFGGTRIQGNLVLRTGRIGGDLACSQAGKWFTRVYGLADMENLRIGANAEFSRARISGSVDLIGATVEGNVLFHGSDIAADLFFQNTSTGGALFLSPAIGESRNVGCRIGGRAWLLGAAIKADAELSGVYIGGHLIMQNAKIGQNVMAQVMGGIQTQIAGSAYLNGAHVNGAVEFAGSVVGGTLNLHHASIGDQLLVSLALDDVPTWRVVPARVSQVEAQSVSVGRRVILAGVTVGRADNDLTTAGNRAGDVDLAGAKIGGDLLLHSPDFAAEYLQTKKVGMPPANLQRARGELAGGGGRPVELRRRGSPVDSGADRRRCHARRSHNHRRSEPAGCEHSR